MGARINGIISLKLFSGLDGRDGQYRQVFMSRIERLLQRKQELNESFALLSEKIVALQQEWALAVDPAIQVKLKHELKQLEDDRKAVEQELEQVEGLQVVQDGMRIEFGMEVVIEQLQIIKNQIDDMAQQISFIMRHLGIKFTK